MLIKQLSVFLENKSGRLTELTRILGETGINMTAFSMSENSDFGILRLIVSDPAKAQEALKAHQFSVSLTDVVCLHCDNTPGALIKALSVLFNEKISIEYMYAFSMGTSANVILRTASPQQCADLLLANGMKLVASSELYSF